MSTEKDKSHPFADYLRKTEKVLWMSAAANRVSVKAISIDVILKMAVVFFLVALGFMRAASNGFYDLVPPVILLVGLTIFLCIPVLFLIIVIRVYRQRRLQHIYVVTNEHLFYRFGQDVRIMALENVRAISVIPGSGTKGTLSFEPVVPTRPNFENAATFKQMVDSFFPEDGTKGPSSIEQEFPMWPDVENAAAVKQLIEGAKARRIQSKP